MGKAVLGLAIIAAVYYLFLYDKTPETLVFQGREFGPKTIEASNDSKSTVYRYNSVSNADSDYLIVIKPDSKAGDLHSWANFWGAYFEHQGFQFELDLDYRVGVRKNDVIYLRELNDPHVIVFLAVEGNEQTPRTLVDAYQIFADLKGIQF